MCAVLFLYCMRAVSVMSGEIVDASLLDGRKDHINATVITSPISVDNATYGYCTVKVNSSIQGHLNKGSKISFYADGIVNFEIGDVLEADVSYYDFDKETGVGFYSDGIFLKAFSESEILPLGKSKDIYGLAGSVRSYIKTRVMSCSDNYHILLAIVTGERCYISDQLYDRVKDAGVSHVLVVSGMHLVLLCTGLERLLRIIFKSGILRDFLLISFVLMMSVVCGFGMSILRAAIVYVLRVIYRRIGRRANGIHSLSFAVVLVLIIHPYAFHSISFQLSYSATLGILVLPKIFNKKLEKYTKNSFILTKVADIMSISLSAYIATLPVCIAAFGELSVVAVAVNVLLDIPANAMLSLCVIGLALGFIPFLEKVFMILADALGDYFIKIVNVASNLPFAKLRLRNEKILVVVLLLCYLALYVTKTKPYRILKKR